jgi:hypothetical protein
MLYQIPQALPQRPTYAFVICMPNPRVDSCNLFNYEQGVKQSIQAATNTFRRKGGAVPSAQVSAEQQIPRPIHQLHGVVGTAAIGMVFGGAAFPGLIHLADGQPA